MPEPNMDISQLNCTRMPKSNFPKKSASSTVPGCLYKHNFQTSASLTVQGCLGLIFLKMSQLCGTRTPKPSFPPARMLKPSFPKICACSTVPGCLRLTFQKVSQPNGTRMHEPNSKNQPAQGHIRQLKGTRISKPKFLKTSQLKGTSTSKPKFFRKSATSTVANF